MSAPKTVSVRVEVSGSVVMVYRGMVQVYSFEPGIDGGESYDPRSGVPEASARAAIRKVAAKRPASRALATAVAFFDECYGREEGAS